VEHLMRAGKLDRLITIERQNETVAPSGAVSSTWTPIGQPVRAEIVNQSATEFLAGHGEAERGTVIFRIRFLAGITTADRIIFNGMAHDLEEIVEIGRRRGLELRAVSTR
jgi:SPP1 family predicted phage head-tail adaptor